MTTGYSVTEGTSTGNEVGLVNQSQPLSVLKAFLGFQTFPLHSALRVVCICINKGRLRGKLRTRAALTVKPTHVENCPRRPVNKK